MEKEFTLKSPAEVKSELNELDAKIGQGDVAQQRKTELHSWLKAGYRAFGEALGIKPVVIDPSEIDVEDIFTKWMAKRLKSHGWVTLADLKETCTYTQLLEMKSFGRSNAHFIRMIMAQNGVRLRLK